MATIRPCPEQGAYNSAMTTVRPHAAAVPGSKAEADASGSAQPPSEASTAQKRRPVTLRTICKNYVLAGEKFACLTCYDATTARWLERAGVPMLLVGDTAAEMILGYPSTIHAPMDFLVMLTAAVKRGAPFTFVMADMPFMSYQAEEAEGIRNAGRFMTEGMADAVKLEVDRSYGPLVEKMARAGVPVVGHIGCRPQQAKLRGGYRSVGRTAEEAATMVADAVAIEKAGAVMLLIEAAPNEVSQRIVEKTNIPVIGCGAGPACHGQIVVLHDMLGLTDWQPAFATPLVEMGPATVDAARQWVDKVHRSDLGEHPYRMKDGDAGKF